MGRAQTFVLWRSSAVRGFASLDSPVVCSLEAGTEVVVVEKVELASGRERLRLVEPVEGWLSGMFVEPVHKQQKSIFEAGPLSAKVLGRIRTRSCVRCGGFAEFADVTRGELLCSACGPNERSLDFDAFDDQQRRILLTGRGTTVGKGDANDLKCACDPGLGESRLCLPFDAKVTIAEHGQGAIVVVIGSGSPLRPGDYVVGVGLRRAWRFEKVVELVAEEKRQRRRHREATWRLVVRRVPIKHQDYVPPTLAPPKVVTTKKTTTKAVATGSGSLGLRSHANQEAVLDYWEDESSDDEEEEEAPQEVHPPVAVAAVTVGVGEDWTSVLERGQDERAVLRGSAVVVGVDDARDHVTYDVVRRAFAAPKRPLLLLCVAYTGSSGPTLQCALTAATTRLGLRLEETQDAGVLVASVDADRASSEIAGVRKGMKLGTVDDIPIVSLPQALALLRRRPCVAAFHHHIPSS